MKNLYQSQLLLPFLLAALLLAAACDNAPEPTPADKLPPATMYGANTFGCLVNGEVWLPHSGSIWDEALNVKHDRGWVGCDQLFIGATKIYSSEKDIYQEIILNVWCPVLGENDLTFLKGVYRDAKGCGRYHLDTLSQHKLFVTRLDTINYIASGTFYFTAINDDCQDTIRITEGRFDADSHL